MTFIFHPAYTQYTPYCAKAKTCPAYARASGLEPSGSALRTAAHALKALCLYCVTGGEPSPDLLLRGYSRVIGSPSGFRCLRALAVHCTPRSRSCSNWLCRAIQCRSTSSSCADPPDAGRNFSASSTRFQCLAGNPRLLPPECSQAKPSCEPGAFYFSWLDRPDFYRSRLPTRTLAAHFAGSILKKFVHTHNTCWHVSEIRAILYSEAQESPRVLTKKRTKEKT